MYRSHRSKIKIYVNIANSVVYYAISSLWTQFNKVITFKLLRLAILLKLPQMNYCQLHNFVFTQFKEMKPYDGWKYGFEIYFPKFIFIFIEIHSCWHPVSMKGGSEGKWWDGESRDILWCERLSLEFCVSLFPCNLSWAQWSSLSSPSSPADTEKEMLVTGYCCTIS